MKFKIFILLTFVLCSCKQKDFTKEEQNKVFKNCLDKILESNLGKQIENCYLVTNILDTLSLYHYSELEKEELYKATNLEKNGFLIMLKGVEESREQLLFSEVTKFSNCNESNIVFSSTKIFKNLIQITYTDYYGSIKRSQLKKPLINKPSQLFKYIFGIKNDCEVELLLQTSVFYD